MKKILLVSVILLFAVFTASAQYNPGYNSKVSRAKAENEAYMEYLKYKKLYKTGLGLTIGGGAALLVGGGVFSAGFVGLVASGVGVAFLSPLAAMTSQPPEYNDKFIRRSESMAYWGAGVAMLGAGMLVVGVPMLCVYRSKMRACVSFGPNPSGIGLSMKF